MHGTLVTIRLTVQGVCLKYDSLQAFFKSVISKFSYKFSPTKESDLVIDCSGRIVLIIRVLSL